MSHGHQHWAETVYDTRPRDSDFDVNPNERIGAPVPRHSKPQIVLRLVCAVSLSGAWLAAVSNGGLEPIVSGARPVLATVLAKAREITAQARGPDAPAKAAVQNPFEPSGFAAASLPGEDGTAPPIFAVTPLQELESEAAVASEATPAEPVGTAYEDMAEPAVAAPDNSPKRKEAADAGLSPDLPNVLLSRLSKEDFKHAAYAIKTAIAKTADDAKFVWPPAPTRNQALFEVRFVTGAAPGCRRYVVTVTKDRWSSTSAALEKCGALHARAG